MKMSIILGGVASSAVILAMAFIYSTAEQADAAVDPKEIVYVERVVEKVVYVPIVQPPRAPRFSSVSDKDKHCLALNVYFEARGESTVGQEAVAWVTLNRVVDNEFPSNICDVVWQDQQFSWTHDGKSDRPKDQVAWATAQVIAGEVLEAYRVERDPTEGATYFHSDSVKPKWHKKFDRVVRIDNHIFYTDNS